MAPFRLCFFHIGGTTMEWTPVRKALLKTYGGIFTVGLLYYFFIQLTGLSIPCYLYQFTGFLCPGCGLTRMANALIGLDIGKAFSYHPVGVIALPFWFGISILGFWGKPKFTQKPAFWYGCLWVTVAVLLLFTLIRNL